VNYANQKGVKVINIAEWVKREEGQSDDR
jgi:hypothetical protein